MTLLLVDKSNVRFGLLSFKPILAERQLLGGKWPLITKYGGLSPLWEIESPMAAVPLGLELGYWHSGLSLFWY
jgi:hypothetical protein